MTAVYSLIAGRIQEQIRQGIFPPGSQLPTARALAAEHQVSQSTMARVLTQLMAEGWVEVRRGPGVYVTTAMQVHPGRLQELLLGRIRLMGDHVLLRSKGRTIRVELTG